MLGLFGRSTVHRVAVPALRAAVATPLVRRYASTTQSKPSSWAKFAVKAAGTVAIASTIVSGTIYSLDFPRDTIKEMVHGEKPQYYTEPPLVEKLPLEPQRKRPRVVILGSGWAALSILRDLDTSLYEVVVVSPRNYFLFTPLLPGTTVGSVEARSIIEPIRRFCVNNHTYIKFFEATCTEIEPNTNHVTLEVWPDGNAKTVTKCEMEYDFLVVAVGAHNNTFGTKGVKEHCHFLKEISDTKTIRRTIVEALEVASFPNQTEDEKKRLLHFMVVGGGPTGVEFAAELNDFMHEDIAYYYPELMKYLKITLIQSGDHILNSFSTKLSEYAEQSFARRHIEVITNTRVVAVDKQEITIRCKSGKEEKIPFQLCVWSTGITPRPMIERLKKKIGGEQDNKMALVTDLTLIVKGTKNIFAAGDCCTVHYPHALAKLPQLFQKADTNNDGFLDEKEFMEFIAQTRKEYPQFDHFTQYDQMHQLFGKYSSNDKVTLDQFKSILQEVDKKSTSLPATAQVAAQEGAYIAKCLNAMALKNAELPTNFKYQHSGMMANIGGDAALADFPSFSLSGYVTYWLWKSVYATKQVSWKCKANVFLDWTKQKVFGRDISKY